VAHFNKLDRYWSDTTNAVVPGAYDVVVAAMVVVVAGAAVVVVAAAAVVVVAAAAVVVVAAPAVVVVVVLPQALSVKMLRRSTAANNTYTHLPTFILISLLWSPLSLASAGVPCPCACLREPCAYLSSPSVR
jgi:hypothetical protein